MAAIRDETAPQLAAARKALRYAETHRWWDLAPGEPDADQAQDALDRLTEDRDARLAEIRVEIREAVRRARELRARDRRFPRWWDDVPDQPHWFEAWLAWRHEQDARYVPPEPDWDEIRAALAALPEPDLTTDWDAIRAEVEAIPEPPRRWLDPDAVRAVVDDAVTPWGDD